MTKFVVTGTRDIYLGSKYRIAKTLDSYKNFIEEITFGGCQGVDTLAACAIDEWDDRPFMRLVLPANRSQVGEENKFIKWDEVIEMPDGSSYMDRNERMLDHGTHLIGMPRGGRERTRSGTWATIRRAEKRDDYTVDIHPLDASVQLWRLK